LVLSAQSFSRNGEQAVIVKVGDQSHHLAIKQGELEVRLPIVLKSDSVDSIEFIPKNPISPKEAGISEDSRKLGIGFVRLRFEE
jgi:phosphoglycerol transferase